MRSTIISEILDRPDAYLIIEEIKSALDREKENRLKFYDAIAENDNVEFINGEIVVQSNVTMRHNQVTGLLLCLLNIYVDKSELGFIGSQRLMISLTRNDYLPGICFFRQKKSAQFTDDQLYFPEPDLVIKVLSDSTEAIDRGLKFQDYQAHGIGEYWVIDPEHETLEQYQLLGKEYQLILKSAQGDVRSFAIEGFQIPIRAIFDNKEYLTVLQNILGSQSSSTLTPPNS
ncbi:Uma2 family endonuclease [Dyadobacter sp. CY351]|uniref:Uma2 family endonuclease n=1 Tax=Dyadobacter sp. CY351 TaxID=2909337 RepID=UPI001F3C409D|nr:Uma2 family endonuclease [Dyadobacter sp. CY351]MCF2519871.1 Uma2 family endonuclease [Dyadobacter sp. CY351]